MVEEDLEWIMDLSCRVLSERVGLGKKIQILCKREVARMIRKTAQKKSISARIVSKHFGEEVAEQEKMMRMQGMLRIKKIISTNKRRRWKKKIIWRKRGGKIHKSYLDVKSLYDWYEALEAKYDIVKMENIGETLEGREIKIVKINSENEGLPVMFVDAGIHAREWISPAAVMFFIDKLVGMVMKGKGQGNLGEFQWHIIPLANPDGYQYSIDKDRMWRKNRAENQGSDCDGVDLNRNFPLAYGISSSKNPCAEDFRGTDAFSEAESATIRDYLESIKDKRQATCLSRRVELQTFSARKYFELKYVSPPPEPGTTGCAC